MDPDLRRALDHVEIIDVLNRYALALDTQDWDLLRTVFTDDAVGDYSAGTYEGFDAIKGLVDRALGPLDASQHLIGSQAITSLDGDAATATCYLHAQHVKVGTPGGDQLIKAGYYTDRLVRTEAGWRIAHRRLTITWENGNPAVLDAR
ncbi:MAG: nuclear transport factor 2 family protein [Acidimicrobiia bacterium]